jgi:hypothetical protein
MHAATVAAEIARGVEDLEDWSVEALAAREALILDNLWMVARLARHHLRSGVDIDDLLQFGALGLFRAFRFTPRTAAKRSWKPLAGSINRWNVSQRCRRSLKPVSRVKTLCVHT